MDNKSDILEKIKSSLENDYIVKYNTNLELVTIRHYDQKTIDFVTRENTIGTKTRSTARFVLGNTETARNTIKEV